MDERFSGVIYQKPLKTFNISASLKYAKKYKSGKSIHFIMLVDSVTIFCVT